jgi:hypothetical protein
MSIRLVCSSLPSAPPSDYRTRRRRAGRVAARVFAADSQFASTRKGPVDGVEYCGRVPRAQRDAQTCWAWTSTKRLLTRVLKRLGLRKAEGGWEIPSYRSDLTREVDLIEEVARVIGMDAIDGCTVAPIRTDEPGRSPIR